MTSRQTDLVDDRFALLRRLPDAIVNNAPRMSTSESALKALVRNVVMPRYPTESLQRGAHGVAVAQVLVDTAGRVHSLQILEAPDTDIKEEVHQAVSQWRFAPSILRQSDANIIPVVTENEKLAWVSGKLVFYFEIQNGRGVVLNP